VLSVHPLSAAALALTEQQAGVRAHYSLKAKALVLERVEGPPLLASS